ncbi:uncharacterized protein LOC115956881 [Quercus lobata]|uniref:uncharacterized protein LOC115956881 n=1 Tax=Quercus lobata TaxID=97700 RepID=UPI0012494A41|nr:uncharacterized protein LOC115956881 [Quercus lobata]
METRLGGERAKGITDRLPFDGAIHTETIGYTWTNRRDLNSLIQERIDRFFTNPSWCLLYPEARVTHLTRCHSDHCPVLMETAPRRVTHLNRPFKFQSFWLSDPSFPGVVMRAWNQSRNLPASIEKFTSEATQWNKH